MKTVLGRHKSTVNKNIDISIFSEIKIFIDNRAFV